VKPPFSVKPKVLLLSMFEAGPAGGVPVGTLIRIAGALGLNGNQTRVALARLVREGRVRAVRRGFYRGVPQRGGPGALIARWHTLEQQTRPWRGTWLGALGAQSRGLLLLGMRRVSVEVWIRPDNLTASFSQLANDLPGTELFRVSEAGPALVRRWTALWPVRLIERRLRAMSKRVKSTLRRLSRLPYEVALPLSFHLVREGVGLLAFDPLLPEELLSGEARRELSALVQQLDRDGRKLWAQAVPESVSTPEASAATRRRQAP
jgi:DNA-binding transcriptional regulator PaaX